MQGVHWSPDWCQASPRDCSTQGKSGALLKSCSRRERHLKVLALPGHPGCSAWPSSKGIFNWVSPRAMADSIWCEALYAAREVQLQQPDLARQPRLLQLPLCSRLVVMQMHPFSTVQCLQKELLNLISFLARGKQDQMMGQEVHCVSLFPKPQSHCFPFTLLASTGALCAATATAWVQR